MSTKTYESALTRLLSHEGGYTNHSSDPGGPTNFGITIYDARRYAAEFGWIVDRKVEASDVRAMPISFAKRVYRAKYWDSQRCDELEPGVDYAMFDYGVNSGVGRSGRVLRRILNLSDAASEVTPTVVAAANAAKAPDLVTAICDERLRFLHGLKTWDVFGRGWGRRVNEVRAFAVSIAEDLPLAGFSAPDAASGRAIDPTKFSRVRALQQGLADAGFYLGAIDGDLGAKTVKAFQRFSGLEDDGIVGPKTRPLLDAAIAAVTPLPALA